jgi:glycosyltransferase involved in cell wall biosynthesis
MTFREDRLKVLHVVQGYHPAIGGTELLIQRVSEELVRSFGDEVTVFTTNAYNCEAFYSPSHPLMPSGVETINGVKVKRFRIFNALAPILGPVQRATFRWRLPLNQYWRTIYGGPIAPQMFLELTTCQADVVAAASFPLLHMYYATIARYFNKRPLVLQGGLHPEDQWSFDRPIICRAIRQSNAYIANTAYERDYLLSKGIQGDRIHVSGVGVEAEPFLKADGLSFRRQHHLLGYPVVAFIGPQGRQKGIDILLQAMRLVWRQIPQARLVIAGGRTSFSLKIEEIIAGLGEERDKVVLIYNFREEEKPEIFAAGDVFAYPSSYESFGIAFLEAWASGKPVIGCRAGAIPMVVEDGQDGLLVPCQDVNLLAATILQLLSDEGLRVRLGQRGRAKVLANYTWDRVVAQFRRVYQEAIEQAR